MCNKITFHPGLDIRVASVIRRLTFASTTCVRTGPRASVVRATTRVSVQLALLEHTADRQQVR